MARRIRTLKVGTRKSALALRQTDMVLERLRKIHPGLEFKIVPITTKGDRIKSAAELRKAGKGLFVKEIERALLKRRIAIAIHSLKDMPSKLPEGLVLGAILEREEAADALVTRDGVPEGGMEDLVVGTSSLRRQAQTRTFMPRAEVTELRGNLDTRIEALSNNRTKVSAIVVAAAAVKRLYGENSLKLELLPKDRFVPCAGQGALCIECREGDDAVLKLLEPLNHPETAAAANAERHLLMRLEGGCQIPLGVHARPLLDGLYRLLHITAFVGLPDGSKHVIEEAKGSIDDPVGVAMSLETLLRSRGATEILEEVSGVRKKPKKKKPRSKKPRKKKKKNSKKKKKSKKRKRTTRPKKKKKKRRRR
ncbi:MAG: hydroxymethylbilane synthase [Planctomycetota bacterium]|jgi:hydroxymethylbilane synthase